MSVCLKDLGVVCSLGQSKQQVFDNLIRDNGEYLQLNYSLAQDSAQFVGQVDIPDSKEIKGIYSRNNQLAYLAYCQISPVLEPLIKKFGKHRVAVVIGTSTASIDDGENARKHLIDKGIYPSDFNYNMQEMVEPSRFVASLCGAKGPVFGVSTACSSSGKALVSAKALIKAGIADVVVTGGVDCLTKLTINGFKSLESISSNKCNPFSVNRDGINIGEAAALFVMSKEDSGIHLLGTGETSDAHHMSAPDPKGDGAKSAMLTAINDAGLHSEQVDYVNLHGTGTRKNDEMEAKAVSEVFSQPILCSSTKRLTGHTLGASGALEIGLCWLMLSRYNANNYTPRNAYDGVFDPDISAINLSNGQRVDRLKYCMSNSFAFGGNNFSAILGNMND